MHEFNHNLQAELPSMWRFALKLTLSQDDAADLVQRTCVRALEQKSTYTPNGKLRNWLFRIQHRIWLNELRHRKIRQTQSFSYTDESTLEFANDKSNSVGDIRIDFPEGRVLAQQIVNEVNALPESQRIAMLLVNVYGFTYSETADILETPIGTIMSRLSRARITIGERLQGKKTCLKPTQKSVESGVTV